MHKIVTNEIKLFQHKIITGITLNSTLLNKTVNSLWKCAAILDFHFAELESAVLSLLLGYVHTVL